MQEIPRNTPPEAFLIDFFSISGRLCTNICWNSVNLGTFWHQIASPNCQETKKYQKIFKKTQKNSKKTLPKRSLAALGELFGAISCKFRKNPSNSCKNPEKSDNFCKIHQIPVKFCQKLGKILQRSRKVLQTYSVTQTHKTQLRCGGLASASSIRRPLPQVLNNVVNFQTRRGLPSPYLPRRPRNAADPPPDLTRI